MPAELGEVPEVTAKERAVTWLTRTGGAIQVPHIGVSFVTLGLPLAALPATVGGGNIAMAPIAHSNENEITDIASMEETNNALQEAVERYAAENERLKQVVKKIEEQVNGMQQSQDALDTITKQQTSSIDEFEEQVKLQKQLVEELKKDKQSGVIQGLLTIIVSSDTDGDFKIDDEEIDGLIEKIEGMGELGVNRELFEQKIKEKKGNFQAILDMCSQIMNTKGKEINENERILWLL